MASAPLESTPIESADAFEAIETYFERGWTDGLPVVPPTPERVARFLEAAGLAPQEVIGEVPTRGELKITAEKLAINAVMAGARPEYMPLIAAAMRALTDPVHNFHSHTATLSGAAQVVIVNGPVRKRLGINSHDGVFGPGWRANATIGRALRLTIRNVARSVHGEFDRSSFSQPGRFSFCFGEDEEESPWPTVAMDAGLAAGEDAVTVYATMWQSTIGSQTRDAAELIEHYAMAARRSLADGTALVAQADNSSYAFSSFYPGRRFMFVLGREHVRVLHGTGRMDKPAVREALYRALTREVAGLPPAYVKAPENVMLVVVRGTAWQQGWFFCPFHSSNPVTRAVARPVGARA
jgi:hypothetical protein